MNLNNKKGFTLLNNFTKGKIAVKQHLTGFTLIELLVVIAIIAVLAAVAIPVVIGVVQEAQNAAITADIRSIYSEAIREHMRTGNFHTIRCVSGDGATADPDIAAMCASIDRANGTPTGIPAPVTIPTNFGIGNVVSHVSAATGTTPSGVGVAFCIQSPLHGGGYRCADHNGHWRIPTAVCGVAFGLRPPTIGCRH